MSINISTFAAIAVYCGAKTGHHPIYKQTAYEFGQLLASRNITLVYGGGDVGLMKAVADGCLSKGGQVVGVITEKLKELELAHPHLSKLYVTQSMQERKFLMSQLADAFVALPGGFGTLEELFEVLSLTQLNYHRKPVGMLNINRYFQPFQEWIKHAHTEGFINTNHSQLLIFAEQSTHLLDKLARASFFDLEEELSKD